MITSRNIWILTLLLSCLSVVSCVTTAREPVSRGRQLSIAEQNEKVRYALQEISRMSHGVDRNEIRPRIETAYIDLIKKYPSSPAVLEGYKQLMMIYLTEYEPPALEKAELLRDEFVRRQPDSDERRLLDDPLADAYYRNAEWEKLMKLTTPPVRRFITGWQRLRPMDMFMYAEAKSHLGDREEARKGYQIVITLFPGSLESSLAAGRLDEIAVARRDMPAREERGRPSNRVTTVDAKARSAPREAKTEGETSAEEVRSSRASVPEMPVPQASPVPEKPPFPDDMLTERAGSSQASAPEMPVPQEPPVPEKPAVSKKDEEAVYLVQTGLFADEKNALSLYETLNNKGYGAFIQRTVRKDGKVLFRVLIGGFHEKSKAAEYSKRLLRKEGMNSIIISEKI
jgi:cell division protein FtsN